MSMSRPVICLDLGGPAVQVTEETGIKVPADTPEQVVSDLASAMQALASDAELRKRMGDAGRRRVEEHFLWEEKAKAFCQIYESVLENEGHYVH
jgi:glycosyltransferase involved in cell wall biosynthesis